MTFYFFLMTKKICTLPQATRVQNIPLFPGKKTFRSPPPSAEESRNRPAETGRRSASQTTNPACIPLNPPNCSKVV
jgi:hypothetical protein